MNPLITQDDQYYFIRVTLDAGRSISVKGQTSRIPAGLITGQVEHPPEELVGVARTERFEVNGVITGKATAIVDGQLYIDSWVRSTPMPITRIDQTNTVIENNESTQLIYYCANLNTSLGHAARVSHIKRLTAEDGDTLTLLAGHEYILIDGKLIGLDGGGVQGAPKHVVPTSDMVITAVGSTIVADFVRI